MGVCEISQPIVMPPYAKSKSVAKRHKVEKPSEIMKRKKKKHVEKKTQERARSMTTPPPEKKTT